MNKFFKVAAVAFIAIAAMLAMGCPETPVVPTTTGTLAPLTDIHQLWTDSNTARQDWETGYGTYVNQDDRRFSGFGINTYEAGSTITFPNSAGDGSKALLYTAVPGAGDNGFNINRTFTNVVQTGWYRVIVRSKFLSTAPANKAYEINITPTTALGVAAPTVDQDRNTLILPTTADADWVNRTFYVNFNAGYSTLSIGFYQGTGAANSFDVAVQFLIDYVSIQKIDAPTFVTEGTANAGLSSTFDAGTVVVETAPGWPSKVFAIGSGATEELAGANWDPDVHTMTVSAAGLRIVSTNLWGPVTFYPSGNAAKLLPAGTYTLSVITGAATTAGPTLTFNGSTLTVAAGASTQTVTGIVVAKNTFTNVVLNNGGSGPNNAGTLEIEEIELIRTGP